MADLNLNINGRNNASGPLNDAAGGVKNLSGEIAKGITIQEAWNKALSVGIGFAKDSFKAYEEQAKADRQLARVAGESTEAFKAQATALQEQLGVSDDMVQTMQKMLLTYGEAPAEIDKTIRSVLDLSAATGQDAVGAISTLTSSVTTGKGAFKDLGLEYDKTGSRGDVLGAATAALAKKFAGSSEAEADSLAGAINKSMQQFGELKDTFGGFIGLVAQKTGIIESATWAFKQFNEAIGGGPDNTRMEAIEKLQHAQNLIQEYATIEKSGVELNQTSRDTLHEAKINYYEALKLVNEIDAKNKPLATKGKADDTAAGNGKAAAEAEKKAAELAKKIREQRFRDAEDSKGTDETLAKNVREANAKMEAEEQKEFEASLKEKADAKKKADDEYLAEHKKALHEQEQATKKAADEQQKQEAAWEHAGAAIGSAFTNALSNAIEELASGGEMDAGETIGSILAAVLAVAGGVLGGALGGPAGAAIGGALGGLAGSAIKGATKRKKVRHSGGYAGEDAPERYHLGTWVGSDEEAAILQNGERVLSRSEVSGMGGKQGVENAVRGGGGGINVSINAFDGSTTQQFFERDGGRALLNAVRTGRGAPARLFGGR